MVECAQLGRDYGARTALSGLDLQIKAGEVVGLLGPNGAGKSTTMKLLSGLLEPSHGRARVAGHDLSTARRAAQAQLGYLPESAPAYPELLVQEHLQWLCELRGLPKRRRRGALSFALEATGLSERRAAPIHTLSKGYRQRLGLAQAILHRPALLILDEPTSGLDPSQVLQIRALIRQLAADSTVLLSSHRLPEVEAVADRALILIDGELKGDVRMKDNGAQRARVCFSPEAPKDLKEQLSALPGVTSVQPEETSGAQCFLLCAAAEAPPLCPEIFQAAAAAGWPLTELAPVQTSLASEFFRLTEEPSA